MRRPPLVLSLAVVISGLSLLLSFSCAKGQDRQIPFEDDPTLPAPARPPLSGCPPLPEQAPEGTVAVYVAKMPEKPGFVCVRAVNGIHPSVGYAGFHWQRKEEGQFQDFTEQLQLPPGLVVGEEAVHVELWPQRWLDRQFPLQNPAPPGAYRACFRYTLHMSVERQEICSEELSLP
jgi:hypothetical protein